MKILYIAELVGKAGVWAVKKILPTLKKERAIDLVVANCDGATGGTGLGKTHAIYLQKLGVDIITGGDFIYYKKDLVQDFSSMARVIRPLNYPPKSPGRAYKVITRCETPIVVCSLLGHTVYTRAYGDNPFLKLEDFLKEIERVNAQAEDSPLHFAPGKAPVILVDFHAGATAEKQSLAYAFDGKASAVFGSHGRVQTTDEKILPGGTAFICDAGRTGSQQSVGGLSSSVRIKDYITQIPDWTQEAWEDLEFQGVIVEVEENFSFVAKATSIERVKISVATEDLPKASENTHNQAEQENFAKTCVENLTLQKKRG